MGSGGDYVNYAALFADMVSATGNFVITQISDVTETSSMFLTIALNGFSITIDSDDPNAGDVNSGYITTLFAGATNTLAPQGTLIVRNLSFRAPAASFTFMSFGSITSGHVTMNNNIFLANGGKIQTIITSNDGFDCYDNAFINVDDNNTVTNMVVIDVSNVDLTAPIRVFNNIIYASGVNVNSGTRALKIENTQGTLTDIFVSNNALESPGVCFSETLSGSGTTAAGDLFNNAATDTTLSGTNLPISSYTPATEFKSIVFSSTEFLHTAVGEQFEEAGTATNNPTTVDIRGLAFGTNPPIGAYTSEETPGDVIGPAALSLNVSISVGIP